MIGVVVVSLLILVVGAIYYSKSVSTTPNIDPNNATLLGGQENVIKAVNQKVVLVEFGDFECPACRAANNPLNSLLSDPKYKDSVTYIWRTFPLHAHSVMASKAAFIVKELSGDPQKFFAMKDILFEKQDEWATESGATNQVELFAGYAKTLGVDETKFRDLINSSKYEDIVEKDKNDALALNVNVTPTFYVNGKQVMGFDEAAIRSLIDADLNK